MSSGTGPSGSGYGRLQQSQSGAPPLQQPAPKRETARYNKYLMPATAATKDTPPQHPPTPNPSTPATAGANIPATPTTGLASSQRMMSPARGGSGATMGATGVPTVVSTTGTTALPGAKAPTHAQATLRATAVSAQAAPSVVTAKVVATSSRKEQVQQIKKLVVEKRQQLQPNPAGAFSGGRNSNEGSFTGPKPPTSPLPESAGTPTPGGGYSSVGAVPTTPVTMTPDQFATNDSFLRSSFTGNNAAAAAVAPSTGAPAPATMAAGGTTPQPAGALIHVSKKAFVSGSAAAYQKVKPVDWRMRSKQNMESYKRNLMGSPAAGAPPAGSATQPDTAATATEMRPLLQSNDPLAASTHGGQPPLRHTRSSRRLVLDAQQMPIGTQYGGSGDTSNLGRMAPPQPSTPLTAANRPAMARSMSAADVARVGAPTNYGTDQTPAGLQRNQSGAVHPHGQQAPKYRKVLSNALINAADATTAAQLHTEKRSHHHHHQGGGGGPLTGPQAAVHDPEISRRLFAEKVSRNSLRFTSSHGATFALPAINKAMLASLLGGAGAVRHKGTGTFSTHLPPPRLVAHQAMEVAPKGAIYRSHSADAARRVAHGSPGRKHRHHHHHHHHEHHHHSADRERERDASLDPDVPHAHAAHPHGHHVHRSPQAMAEAERIVNTQRSVSAFGRFGSVQRRRKDEVHEIADLIMSRRREGSTTDLTAATTDPDAGIISILPPRRSLKLEGPGGLEEGAAANDALRPSSASVSCSSSSGSYSDEEEEEDEEDDDEYEVISYTDAISDMLPFAVPAIISYGLTMLLTVIPLGFVGNHLGEEALAGASVGYFLLFIVAWYPILGMMFALDTLCSHEYGRDPDSDGLGLLLQRGLLVGIGFLIPICLFFYNFVEMALLRFYPATAAHHAAEFLHYAPLFLFPLVCFAAFSKFLANQMLPHLPMLATLIGVGITPVLQHFLVGYGLRAVTLGIAVATWTQLIIVLALTFCREQTRRTFGALRIREALCYEDVITYLKIAIPSAIFVAAEASSFDVTILFTESIGDGAASAWSALLNYEFIFDAAAAGISAAACAKVGAAVGANQPVNARTYARAAVMFAVTWAVLVNWPVIFIFYDKLMGYFGGNIAEANKVKYIVLVMHLFDVLQFTFQGIFSGANMNHLGAHLMLWTLWGVGVPCAIFFGFGWAKRLSTWFASTGLAYPLWAIFTNPSGTTTTTKTSSHSTTHQHALASTTTTHGGSSSTQHHAAVVSSSPSGSSELVAAPGSFYWNIFSGVMPFIEGMTGLRGIAFGFTIGLAVLAPLMIRALLQMDWDDIALQAQLDDDDEEDEELEEDEDEEEEEEEEEDDPEWIGAAEAEHKKGLAITTSTGTVANTSSNATIDT